VTTLVNSIMRSPCWGSTAIFLSWDDWGGFYDHVVPPVIDEEGYGFRVPGLVITPYARAGYVDHQQLSHLACTLDAHGHLNLLRHRRHLGLRRVRTTLAAGHTVKIALALSSPNLAAVRGALAAHHTVKASIEVQGVRVNGKQQTYQVTITLTDR
jgi:Phosphoesterase family